MKIIVVGENMPRVREYIKRTPWINENGNEAYPAPLGHALNGVWIDLVIVIDDSFDQYEESEDFRLGRKIWIDETIRPRLAPHKELEEVLLYDKT